MKKIIVAGCALLASICVQAQSAEADSKDIMGSLQENGVPKSLDRLNASLKTYPDNYLLLKDKVMIHSLNRDFSNVIGLGKGLLDRPEVDDQMYILVGSAYASLSENKDAIKTFKKGISKFPNSSLLYANLGPVQESNGDLDEASSTYEKGIQVDPNISGNYYSLSKLYAKNNNPLWSVIYGEMFVDLESLTPRTKEIKSLLFNQYKALFATPAVLGKYSSEGKAFEKAVANTFAKYASILNSGVSTESLIALRGQFVVEWYQDNLYKEFPFRLFDRQRQLLKQGNFEAYNQWLFSSSNESAYNNWASNNADALQSFENYHRNVIFKPSSSEYYLH